MKEFFSITEDKYIFEIWDITTLITVFLGLICLLLITELQTGHLAT